MDLSQTDTVGMLGDEAGVVSEPIGETLGDEESDRREEQSSGEQRQARAQRREERRRRRAAGPEELLEALKDGQLLAACFVRELEKDRTVQGQWSGRLRQPDRDDAVDDVSSTLSPSFNGCISHALRSHLEHVGYG